MRKKEKTEACEIEKLEKREGEFKNTGHTTYILASKPKSRKLRKEL